MKLNAILPFLIPVVIAGGLIGYNELDNNVLLEMLNNNNANSDTQNTTEPDVIETQQNQETVSVLEQTNTETIEIPPTKTNTVTQENTVGDNANEITEPEVGQTNNQEFITELIKSQATTAQKSYNCGSKGCFETAFKDCASAIGIDEVLKPYSQKTQYEIIGMGETGCKVKTTFQISFFPDWEGKSITCELNNTLSITEAAGLIYQPNGSETLNCQGELLQELKKYGY